MIPHECPFDWCTNDRGAGYGQLEHMSDVWSVRASGESVRTGLAEDLPAVDLSIWLQEDTDVAPTIHLTIASGKANADLYINEAVLLAEHLRRAINAASAGSKLDPAAIIKQGIKS